MKKDIYYKGKIYKDVKQSDFKLYDDSMLMPFLQTIISYELIGYNPFSEGQPVVLGKDYKLKEETKNEYIMYVGDEWGQGSVAPVTRIVAVALSVDVEGEKGEDAMRFAEWAYNGWEYDGYGGWRKLGYEHIPPPITTKQLYKIYKTTR